jgi:membrane protease YdiL (CAAX protease family)
VIESGDPGSGMPAFGAGKAIASFVLFIAAQCLGGVPVGLYIVARTLMTSGGRPPTSANVQQVINDHMGAVLLSVGLAEILMLVALVWLWRRPLLAAETASGLGFHRVPAAQTLAWSALGLATMGSHLLVSLWVMPMPADTPLGPVATAATMGGWTRAAWAIFALLIAPPAEELMFRGLMYRGFANSWGSSAAAIVVTVLFVALHIPETFGYWPATVTILALAVAAMASRVRTGALWAPMAIHFVHNATLVGVVYAGV